MIDLNLGVIDVYDEVREGAALVCTWIRFNGPDFSPLIEGDSNFQYRFFGAKE